MHDPSSDSAALNSVLDLFRRCLIVGLPKAARDDLAREFSALPEELQALADRALSGYFQHPREVMSLRALKVLRILNSVDRPLRTAVSAALRHRDSWISEQAFNDLVDGRDACDLVRAFGVKLVALGGARSLGVLLAAFPKETLHSYESIVALVDTVVEVEKLELIPGVIYDQLPVAKSRIVATATQCKDSSLRCAVVHRLSKIRIWTDAEIQPLLPLLFGREDEFLTPIVHDFFRLRPAQLLSTTARYLSVIPESEVEQVVPMIESLWSSNCSGPAPIGAIDPLRTALVHQIAKVRYTAIRLLFVNNAPPEAPFTAIFPALTDQDRSLRIMAYRLLSKYRSLPAPFCFEALTHEDVEIRLAAIRSFQDADEIDERGIAVATHLARLLGHPDRRLRKAASTAIKRLRVEDSQLGAAIGPKSIVCNKMLLVFRVIGELLIKSNCSARSLKELEAALKEYFADAVSASNLRNIRDELTTMYMEYRNGAALSIGARPRKKDMLPASNWLFRSGQGATFEILPLGWELWGETKLYFACAERKLQSYKRYLRERSPRNP